jgi:hypothetical protein
MRYTLFLYGNESAFAAMPPQAFIQVKAAFEGYTQALKDAGVFVTTDWLKPSGTATMLSMKDGARVVQDGAYADTKEQLGGFYVIDVANLDEALNWAEKCPAARNGKIEIRPSAM